MISTSAVILEIILIHVHNERAFIFYRLKLFTSVFSHKARIVSDQQTDTQTSSNNKSQQRKKGLSIFILLLLLIAIGSAAYWFSLLKALKKPKMPM